jgi:hypothetical protein
VVFKSSSETQGIPHYRLTDLQQSNYWSCAGLGVDAEEGDIDGPKYLGEVKLLRSNSKVCHFTIVYYSCFNFCSVQSLKRYQHP